jgi:hypothetical protein
MFAALLVVQLHAIIPHHHHEIDVVCHSDDWSHPDMGVNHMEDLKQQNATFYFPLALAYSESYPNQHPNSQPTIFIVREYYLDSHFFRSCAVLRGPPCFV